MVDWDELYGHIKKGVRNYITGFRGGSTKSKAVDSMFDTHPATEKTYRNQQNASRIPIVGKWYSDYMYNKSLSEYNKQLRDDYNITWDKTKYPWLSSVWNGNPNASVFGSALSAASLMGGAKISKNLKELYAPDKRKRGQRRIDSY